LNLLKNEKVISWINILDEDIREPFKKRVFFDFDAEQQQENVLFCGKAGDFSLCKDCNDFSKCYDNHCNINDDNYKIDYVVPQNNIYVMIDDDFWHGLTLSEEDLNNPSSQIDIMITEIYLRDQYFNEHCKSKKLPLVRFSARDISLFTMSRVESIVPYFWCGPKRKVEKFFKLYSTSVSNLINNIFEAK
jgi:hypothetical protein